MKATEEKDNKMAAKASRGRESAVSRGRCGLRATHSLVILVLRHAVLYIAYLLFNCICLVSFYKKNSNKITVKHQERGSGVTPPLRAIRASRPFQVYIHLNSAANKELKRYERRGKGIGRSKQKYIMSTSIKYQP